MSGAKLRALGWGMIFSPVGALLGLALWRDPLSVLATFGVAAWVFLGMWLVTRRA